MVSARELALTDGEHFNYRLSWGLFGHAGELEISAEAVSDEPETRTRITMLTSTRGFIRALYPFDGKAQSIYDNMSGQLLEATATTMTPTKETNAIITLDYAKAEADYVDRLRPDRSLKVAIPERTPADFITTMIQTRNWDLDVGEKKRVAVLFDDEFYELEITAEKEETIKTPWGAKRVLMLVPRMPENPKGMFRKGGEVRVWISRDETRLPLRFQVKLGIGTALAILTDYHTEASPQEGTAGSAGHGAVDRDES